MERGLSADEGLSGEENRPVPSCDTSVIYSREQFNPWLRLQNNCPGRLRLILAALLESSLGSTSSSRY